MTEQAREFHAVVMQHEPYLRGIALRLSGDRDIARDLVQETLARAVLHFAEFKPGTNVRAWLATILTRLFLDQRKHDKVVAKASQQLVTLDNVACEIDLSMPGVQDAALWGAVNALDPDLHQVVVLRYLNQLSYKEIADQLQLPMGTVSTRLMRAHERLRELLQPWTA